MRRRNRGVDKSGVAGWILRRVCSIFCLIAWYHFAKVSGGPQGFVIVSSQYSVGEA